jgi:hypothetical protein
LFLCVHLCPVFDVKISSRLFASKTPNRICISKVPVESQNLSLVVACAFER